MNLQHWYYVAEIVASIAVVFSLCFLALELRLYLRQARDDSMDLVTSRRHDLLRVMAEDGELADIVWKGLAGTPRLPAHEWSRFGFYIYALILEYERAWLKVKAGLLDQHVLQTWDHALSWWLQHPGMGAWWRGNHPGFQAGFTAYMNDKINQVIVDPTIATAVAAAIREHEHQRSGRSMVPVTEVPEIPAPRSPNPRVGDAPTGTNPQGQPGDGEILQTLPRRG